MITNIFIDFDCRDKMTRFQDCFWGQCDLVFFSSNFALFWFFCWKIDALAFFLSSYDKCFKIWLVRGAFSLAKFICANVSDIAMQYCLPYLPRRSDGHRNDPFCVTPPKMAKVSKGSNIADVFAFKLCQCTWAFTDKDFASNLKMHSHYGENWDKLACLG